MILSLRIIVFNYRHSVGAVAMPVIRFEKKLHLYLESVRQNTRLCREVRSIISHIRRPAWLQLSTDHRYTVPYGNVAIADAFGLGVIAPLFGLAEFWYDATPATA